MNKLLTPVTVGRAVLRNRVVMAPMTRSRAGIGDVPTNTMVEYYRQRASAGLIITEGTYPSPNGKGYRFTPGICSEEQVRGWSEVVKSVHCAGGVIALQIMHCGRIGHPRNKSEGAECIAPSAIAALGRIHTDQGKLPFPVPTALTVLGILKVVEDIGEATERAMAAGFDFVELHGANGYLPNQFLGCNSNHRTDAYGGSVRNRIRFIEETLGAMIGAAGSSKVGIRLSPGNPFSVNDLEEEDAEPMYTELFRSIDRAGLAYLHVERLLDGPFDSIKLARRSYSGTLIANNGYTLAEGEAAVADGLADIVAYGRYYIANPDLVARIRCQRALSEFDPSTVYGAGERNGSDPAERGYVDYPVWNG